MFPEHGLHRQQLQPLNLQPRNRCRCDSECQVEHCLQLIHHEQFVKVHLATCHRLCHIKQLHQRQPLRQHVLLLKRRHDYCDTHQRSAQHQEKHVGLLRVGELQNLESLQGFHPTLFSRLDRHGDQMPLQQELQQVLHCRARLQATHHLLHWH